MSAHHPHDEEAERWRSVVASAVDGIIVIDARGLIEVFNPAAERLFGYPAAEVIGRNISMLMPEPYRSEHDSYMSRYLSGGAARVIGIGREVRAQRRDGSVFPVHLSVGEMSIAGERKFTGILHDLSDRVRLEEQLRDREALARLGEMAAVIAHEVKNPLAGIRGAIQMIGKRPGSEEDGRIIKEVLGRIDGLSEMMKDLLLFARPPQPRIATVELMPLIRATVDLFRLDPAVQAVAIELRGAAPPLPLDPVLMQTVLLNLLINSAHAMKGQGRITIEVRADGEWCAVAVIDAGPGIPAGIRDKVFTPFFTTKSRGTGLGLPTAKRLVEAQRGTMALECPASGGTTVTVRLPTH